jgi:hypothetical protein
MAVVMDVKLDLTIRSQPNAETCGPTCLHAVYRYFGRSQSLGAIIREVPRLPEGGTLGVLLGCHALRLGYRARIYSYNLNLFDPTWFALPGPEMARRLKAQRQFKRNAKLRLSTEAYLDFLELGGELRSEDLTAGLIRNHLNRSQPILTGLSATYLYRSRREFGPHGAADDVRGRPVGHFVILSGYDRENRLVQVSDPLMPNPVSPHQHYEVSIDRVIGAILLGIVTYDANLLIIHPP